MYDPDDEDWTASSWLAAHIEDMRNSYLDLWDLRPLGTSSLFDEDSEELDLDRRLSAIGEAIVPAALTLRMSPQLHAAIQNEVAGLTSEERSARIARTVMAFRIVSHAVTLDLAFEAAATLLKGAEQRVTTLIDLLAARQVDPRTGEYLQRAARLYLWGFDAECTFMCSATLEAAYPDRFPDERMDALGFVCGRGGSYAVYQYEEAALKLGIFTREERDRASELRQSRNHIVHHTPSLSMSGEAALKTCAYLLDRLLATP